MMGGHCLFLQLAFLLSYNSSVRSSSLHRDLLSVLHSGTVADDSTRPLSSAHIPGVGPEATMTFCEMADYNGYKCEEYLHEVVTEDGFLLTLHRLTGKNSDSAPRPANHPVFLQHGLLCSSDCWILNLPNESLAFMLVDAGYDVWLGNSRGTIYSTAHKTLKPDEDAFWAWSWDEMAQYDLPASINFVLNHTGYDQLHYIGHSQGTLTAFVHLSVSQTNKIRHMIALAPIFHIGSITSPMRFSAPFAKQVAWFMKIVGVRDLKVTLGERMVADIPCNSLSPIVDVCAAAYRLLFGLDMQQFNTSRMPIYLNHSPAGSSVRDLVHYAQMYESKKCSRFDYGSAAANIKHYGTPEPPAYNLISITNTPITLYWAQNDKLADPKDVKYIIENLKTLQEAVYIAEWGHLDFLMSVDAGKILYRNIIHLIQKDYPPNTERPT